MVPWNAPILLLIRSAATPLICGNTVVLRPSECCPYASSFLTDALHDVRKYICAQVVTRLIPSLGGATRRRAQRFTHVRGEHTFSHLGDNCPSGSQEDRSTSEPSFRCIPMCSLDKFTGSDRVARILAGEAAKHLKSCVFELGGKAPAVVRITVLPSPP